MELKSKVVIITGGSRGFGKALAQLFLRERAKVVICSHHKDEIRVVAREIGALGAYADVTKEQDLTSIAQFTLKQLGQIDIWINNAGLWLAGVAENADMSQARIMFDVNVIGAINGSRVALRVMKESNSGTIINILSGAALDSRPGISMYAASKWALNGFTKSIREENRDKNISVLSVFPGPMQTDFFGEDKSKNVSNFMSVDWASQKVIDNLSLEKPEEEIIIKRETLSIPEVRGSV
jgi:NAD(P)-dependent dehydrogenase (short-subunit alcohol dehydrogenase family)